MQPHRVRRAAPVVVAVEEPEAPRHRVQGRDRAGRDRVVRGGGQRAVQFAVCPQERVPVAGRDGTLHAACDLAEARAINRRAAPRRSTRDQPVEFAPGLEHLQLLAHVDAGHDHPAPGQDLNQVLAGKALQRLADRRRADADPLAQNGFRDHAAGREFERHDHLLEPAAGLFVQSDFERRRHPGEGTAGPAAAPVRATDPGTTVGTGFAVFLRMRRATGGDSLRLGAKRWWNPHVGIEAHQHAGQLQRAPQTGRHF